MFDTVKISFPGDVVELVPSLKAVELINERFGNFQNALTYVGAMDFNAMVEVIDAGIDPKKKGRGYKKEVIKENLYEYGFMNAMPDLVEFIMLCSNGGKKPSDEDNDDNDSKKKMQ